MANKHMKNCLLVIRGMQIKDTRDHYPSVRMVGIKRTDILSADKDAE